jgi:hypothetical protein
MYGSSLKYIFILDASSTSCGTSSFKLIVNCSKSLARSVKSRSSDILDYPGKYNFDNDVPPLKATSFDELLFAIP